MYFVEILGSKSKQQNDKNFNKIALILRLPSKPYRERKQKFFADGFDSKFESKYKSYFIKILAVLF